MAGKHTWEKCSKKDVVQIGVKNKCVVTRVVSCIVNGNLIPFQVVYKSKTNRSLLRASMQKGLWIIVALH
jgi:hypothetical protein